MAGNYTVIQLEENKSSTHTFFPQEQCLFQKNATRNGIVYLKCIEANCLCRAKIKDKIFSRTNDEHHNHETHSVRAEYEIKFSKLREEVKNQPLVKVRDLYDLALPTISVEASGYMTWRHVRQTLYRIRHVDMPTCGSLSEFTELLEVNEIIYQNYGTLRETVFYQGAAAGQPIFANLEILGGLPTDFSICIDATYSVTPFAGTQLLVILADISGKPRPILYSIMSSKSQKDYEAILYFAREAIFSFDGSKRTLRGSISDFELGLRNALTKIFPNVTTYGCNFHFNQALRRKASKLPSLSAKITGKTSHHKCLLMFMRLSLLPIDKIVTGLDALIEHINSSSELANDFSLFIEYFKRTWMKIFPPQEWCVNGLTRRTNNNLEGYNNQIKQKIPLNPTPWNFMEGLLKLARDASANYQNDLTRQAPPLPDRSTITKQLNEELLKLENGEINELKFLLNMS
jgi:hypothetical protein